MGTYRLAPATRLSDLIPAKLRPRLENTDFERLNSFPRPVPQEPSLRMDRRPQVRTGPGICGKYI
jgi:hypothetical protein